MGAGIWLGTKKYELTFSGGWYKGEDFKLFSLTLFAIQTPTYIEVFTLHIAKFSMSIMLDEKA